MTKYVKDMTSVIEEMEQTDELKRMSESILAYVDKEELTTDQQIVEFLLLISAILDIPEETFNLVIVRLNYIMRTNKSHKEVQEIVHAFVEMNRKPNGQTH